MSEIFRAAWRLNRLGIAILRARWEARGLSTAGERALWQQTQARRMLEALDICVSVTGHPPSSTGLMVSNHLGYLDVLAIASQGPMVFVAKSDVRKWPFIGPLLEAAGTILAKRGKPLSAGETAAEIRTALSGTCSVVLFPEGTSSDGSAVLPFKPTLLQAALDAGAPISPTAITYHSASGNPAKDVCYWSDAVFPLHLAKLATLRGVTVAIHFGPPIAVPENRKEAARILHLRVSQLMEQGKRVRPETAGHRDEDALSFGRNPAM